MSVSRNQCRIGVDVGGTFTDVILAERSGGSFQVAKTPSVPDAQAAGFFAGVDRILSDTGFGPDEVGAILHGSTIATNAILEDKGARTGLITTAGFRHVLEIGRAEIPRAANLFSWIKPRRPVPARHVFEVPGRIRQDGSEAAALDENTVCTVIDEIRAASLEAIAVVLLHSYANPDHERRVGALLRSHLPNVEVALSVDVMPVFREYERMVATTLNAAVQPVVGHYVSQLAGGLDARKIGAPLLLMKSNGGTCPPDEAARGAVHLALSGPAAGTRGAAWLGRLAGFDDMLTIDMGGTSADVALIRGGEPARTTTGRIGVHPLALPIIDIHTIGAGGGSIATVTDQGAIRVGPESAGADPGPACYGRGGHRPTVSDANLILGRIPPRLLDGEVALDRDAAAEAIHSGTAKPLDLDVNATARGIIDLVNANMTGALKLMSVERGLDPRDFALAAFGGAGPVHGADLMRSLGTRHLLIPRYPGILCAIGLLTTNLCYDFAVTRLQRDGNHDATVTEEIFAELTKQAEHRLAADGIPPEHRCYYRAADMRYERQGVELTVPVADDTVTKSTLSRMISDFHALHEQLYTFANRAAPVEIVNLRLEAVGMTEQITLPEIGTAPSSRPQPTGSRLASLDGATPRPTPTYRREALLADHLVVGPAIIDQFDSTTVILPGQHARTDRHGTLIVMEGAP